MPGFDGTGPRGMGPMTGGGRGFCRPWGMGVAPRAYGFPRWTGYGYPYYGARQSFWGSTPLAPQVSREQELEFLKNEAHALRDGLKELETRIGQLSGETR